jgi:hypothetical protein
MSFLRKLILQNPLFRFIFIICLHSLLNKEVNIQIQYFNVRRATLLNVKMTKQSLFLHFFQNLLSALFQKEIL